MPCGEFGPVKVLCSTLRPAAPDACSPAYSPPGRPLGLLWAERPAGQPWGDAEREYLVLSAKAVERSPAMAALVGPVIDPERLSQRLADASVIAGRMAHDFDNILTGIIGFSDLAQPMLQAGSQAAGFVAEIAKVATRHPVHAAVASTEPQRTDKPSPGSVSSAVAKEEQRLKPQMSPSLRVEKDVPASLAAVAVDGGPLQSGPGTSVRKRDRRRARTAASSASRPANRLTEAEARTYVGKPGGGATSW